MLVAAHKGSHGENQHIHFCIELTKTIQKQSFDVRVKKLFKLIGGNAEFSSKVWDLKPEACSYLFHEDDVVILLNKGYSDEDIEFFKKLNERTQQIVEANKSAGANKSVLRIMEIVGPDCRYDEIINCILDQVREGQMYHPGFRMPNLIQEIYIKTRSNSKFDEWKGREIHKIMEQYHFSDD